MIKDQLSWEEFLKNSPKNQKIGKGKPFNRLVVHSKNLFVISGYGAFTKGYLIVITKDYLSSFGLIENKNLDELNFVIKICQKLHFFVVFEQCCIQFSLLLAQSGVTWH